MIHDRRALATTIAACGLLTATPAQASDFSGMGTFFLTICGGTGLWTAGTVFAASRRSTIKTVRQVLALAGVVLGIALSAWWIIDPIAEGPAILILLAVPIVALMIASSDWSGKPKDPD